MKVINVPVDAGDVLLVPGDMHHDVQDQAAIDVMLAVAEDLGVNSVTLVGDTFESAGLSRHKSMRAARAFVGGGATVGAERAAAAPNLAAMLALAPFDKRHILSGNHEAWFQAVQEEYPGLLGVDWIDLYGTLFDGWHVHDEATALRFGPLLVCHGHRLRGSLAKNSAVSVLANYPGQNTLYGHTHRCESATTPTYKYGVPVAHGAWTIGHLKRRDVELMDPKIGLHSERHQQGFAIVRFFDRGGVLGFEPTICRIHRDSNDRPMVVYGNAVYR